MTEKNNKLTLVDRAFALPDSEKEFGMKIADHKLICNVLDDHLDSIMGKVDEKILKTLQSDTLTDTIADKVYEKLAEFNQPILTKLETLINGIEEIKKHNELEIKRLDGRADMNRDAVKDLRTDYEIYKEHLEYLAKVKPTLQTIQKVFKFWTWKENWKKIIATIVGIFVLIFALFWMFLMVMKFKGFVTMNESKKSAGIEKIEADIKIGNILPNVRGIHKMNLSAFTKHQKDSVNDIIHEQNERDIEESINIRNKVYEEKFGKK